MSTDRQPITSLHLGQVFLYDTKGRTEDTKTPGIITDMQSDGQGKVHVYGSIFIGKKRGQFPVTSYYWAVPCTQGQLAEGRVLKFSPEECTTGLTHMSSTVDKSTNIGTGSWVWLLQGNHNLPALILELKTGGTASLVAFYTIKNSVQQAVFYDDIPLEYPDSFGLSGAPYFRAVNGERKFQKSPTPVLYHDKDNGICEAGIVSRLYPDGTADLVLFMHWKSSELLPFARAFQVPLFDRTLQQSLYYHPVDPGAERGHIDGMHQGAVERDDVDGADRTAIAIPR